MSNDNPILSYCRRACGFQNLVGTSVPNTELAGAPVAFKTWWGHQYMLGIICPPGWNRIKVAAKTWWGPVPMSPYPQARLPIYRRCSERKRFLSIKSFKNTFSYFRTNLKKNNGAESDQTSDKNDV